MRNSGLDVMGEVAWGAHFCQFFQTRQDLLEILVPYFRTGLEDGEFCMWITSEPLHTEEARAALAAVVPDLEGRVAAGQIEILDYREWYLQNGRFNADRVLRGWIDKLEAAQRRGFAGLRLTGNTFWLEDRLWKDFSEYEAAVDSVIGRYPILALCTYSLDKCGAFQVVDVVRNHQFALIRQGDQWEIIRSVQREKAESALRESEDRYRTLFGTMSEGFALHEILCDEQGRPYDYRFLEVNPAFEQQTGLKAGDLIGRTVREMLPGIEPIWIERYGRVALTGKPERFEARAEALGRWYEVRAYRTAPRRFAVVFTDITDRKQTEKDLREAHERLQLQTEELQTANEELQTQAEELQASNEELREQELVLRESEERFRATYEQAAIGIELQNLEGRYLRGNGTLCRILGYSQQELQQRCFSDITHPEDLPREMLLLDDLLAGRIPNYTIEKRYLHKDGHSVWVRVTASLARTNQPYRISIIEDVTERKQAEEALRESEERYRRFFDEDLTGDFLATPDGRVLECNTAFAEIYRFADLADAAQCNLSEFNPEDWAHLMDCLRIQGRVQGHQCVHRRLDGTEIRVVANVVGRFRETGELAEVKGYLFDDTERTRAEEQLHEAHERLQLQTEELQTANQELQSQAEELRVANEELREQELALRESEERYHRFFNEDLTGDLLATPDGRVIECNPAFAEIYGFADLADAAQSNLSRFNPEDWASLVESLRTQGKVQGHQCVHRRPDGTEIHVVANVVGRFDRTGELREVKGYLYDDTERKRAEDQLLTLNRTLRALSNSSQALTHATDEAAYLQEVCRIIVEDCGHALVWIGYAEQDEARSVRPVAYAGFEEGYLETLQITWADTERGRGPTGTAARTGKPNLCRNMLTDPAFAPWREQALRRGYASSIALPLLSGGRVFGVVTIYSRQPDPFSTGEAELLRELAADLAYGITSLRLRAAHAEAEQALRESEARLRLAQDAANAGTWEWNLQTNENFWSEELWRLYGLEPHGCEPSYEAWCRTVQPEDLPRVERAVQEAARQETMLNVEWRVRDPQGQERWLMSRGQPVRDAQGRTVSYRGIVLDITNRKQAEQALRESEQRFKLLSEVTARLLAADDPQTVIEDLCRAVMEYLDCECFFNFLADPASGRLRLNACAGVPPEERENLEWLDYGAAVCGCVARDGHRIVAEHIPTSDDERTELVKSYGIKAYACHPIMAGARVLGTLSFGAKTHEVFQESELSLMKTVTDMVAIAVQRQRDEVALRESEQRLRLALEGGRMGRWEWDVSRDTTFWDRRIYDLLGLHPGAPAASSVFFSMIDRRDRNAVQEHVQKALADGEDFHAEFRVRRPNGETPWLVSQGKVIRDAQGQAVRMMGVMYDITQRKHMEADLRRLNDQLEEEVQAQTEELKDTIERLEKEVSRRVLAEGRLRRRSQMLEAFFQHTITPLAFMDRDFNFVRVNAAYAEADGKDPEYFVGKNHFALYPHDENRAIFEQVVRTKQPYFARAKAFTYPDTPDRVTYWDWQLTPLLDERGEVQFLVLNLENVTEQQTAFQQLEHRARQLQKLTLELSQAEDRERKRLAEILHDDLQQQLAAAKFHLSLLNNRIPESNEVIGNTIGQLDQILKDAIEKSRSLSHELSPAVLYQNGLGETFEWLARQLKAKHGLTVHVENRDSVDSAPEALKVFLYKTAQEILFNVVKHGRVKEARLRLQRMGSGVWLTISDRGQGFDPGSLGRTDGFGLLSIRERIELLGGRMKIRSALGRGSTFLIAVPDGQCMKDRRQRTEDGRLRADGSTVPRSPSSDRRPASSVLRVLLADDHKVVREGLASLLTEQPDLEVVGQAGNGREAVDLAYQLRPDVVVMDVAMPLMAGDEATRQIKLHLPEARVVALSMFEETDMSEAMCRAGAERYLLKTAPSDELLAAIRGKTV